MRARAEHARVALVRSHPSLVAVLAVALGALGCKSRDTTFELGYPSLVAFAHSSFARLTVHPSDPADIGSCTDLLRDAERGSEFSTPPVLDSGTLDVCAFRNSGVSFDEVPEGQMTYVAIVTDGDGSILLTGCLAKDIYRGNATVSIQLTFTPLYHTRYDMVPVACTSVEEKCAGACSAISPDGG